MTGWILFVSLGLLSSCSLAQSNDDEPIIHCGQISPLLWCKNDEIAKKCGFAEQCNKYKKESANKKLQLTVLFESLCPDCQEFITGPLYNDVYTRFSDYVDIESGEIQCQHGKKECEINRHEQCAIHFLPDPLPYIYCLELKLHMGIDFKNASNTCFQKVHATHVEFDQILHCVNTQKGDELQLEAAKRTDSAWPDKHKFVPWLYFNNASLANAQYLIRDLPVVLCDWINKPIDACKGVGQQTKNGCLKTDF